MTRADAPKLPARLQLDPETEASLIAFAKARGFTPQEALRAAVRQYLALPERHPVGGIITPV